MINFFGKPAQVGSEFSKPFLDKAACLVEWILAKETVMQNVYLRDYTNSQFKLLFNFFRDSFPNILVLGKLCLIMPYHFRL